MVESLANVVNHLANNLQFVKLKPSKLKPFKLVVTINNPLADLFVCKAFFCQTLEKRIFIKHSPQQTFLLCGMLELMT